MLFMINSVGLCPYVTVCNISVHFVFVVYVRQYVCIFIFIYVSMHVFMNGDLFVLYMYILCIM